MSAEAEGEARGGRLREILIDDATWDAGSEARRQEWRVVMADLLADHRFDVPGEAPLRLHVTHGPSEIRLELTEAGGPVVAQATLPASAIQPHIAEYLDTVREMISTAQSSNSPRLEALDIAKRIIHDEGAEAVRAYGRLLRPDHATARRLFTLIVTLRVDTAQLALPA